MNVVAMGCNTLRLYLSLYRAGAPRGFRPPRFIPSRAQFHYPKSSFRIAQSVPFTITFSPLVTGTVNATLTLTSNANPATTTEGLTGTGTAAPTHSVALSWNASTSLGIVGYNVYRAPYTTSCGAYAKLNPALNTGTLYTDTTVAKGNNYCYATTAVDSSSRESSYSNVVSNVQVPVP